MNMNLEYKGDACEIRTEKGSKEIIFYFFDDVQFAVPAKDLTGFFEEWVRAEAMKRVEKMSLKDLLKLTL